MRKIIIVSMLSLLMAGCSSNKTETAAMNCSLKQDSNGGVMEVSSDFEYDKDKDIILSQKQHTLITVSDQNTYDQMVQTFQASQQANDYKDIKGVSYHLKITMKTYLLMKPLILILIPFPVMTIMLW